MFPLEISIFNQIVSEKSSRIFRLPPPTVSIESKFFCYLSFYELALRLHLRVKNSSQFNSWWHKHMCIYAGTIFA